MCLSLPASISDRGTPGNILQRGTVSAFPSVYRASYSKGTAYYTPVCVGGEGVPCMEHMVFTTAEGLSSFQLSYRYGC